jgi:hypothetical protein
MCGNLDAAVDGSQVSLSHLVSAVMLYSVCMLTPKKYNINGALCVAVWMLL